MKRSALLVTLLIGLFSASASQAWWFTSTYTKTKYPIVLVPGVMGFDSLLGIDYWYRIPAELREDGAKVYVVQLSAFNSTEARGEQLLAQVRQIIAATGAGKVNLIGHSHGGPTARYVAGVRPDLVASITTISAPHKGTPIADLMAQVPAGGAVEGVLGGVLDAFAVVVDFLSGGGLPQDTFAAIRSLDSKGMAAFNARFPQGVPATACGSGAATGSNGMRFYSWAGSKPLTNVLDISDLLTGAASLTMGGQRSDGIVPACSARFGTVIRDDYRMNHLDEINLLFGLTDLWETDPVAVYRTHANRLKNAGL